MFSEQMEIYIKPSRKLLSRHGPKDVFEYLEGKTSFRHQSGVEIFSEERQGTVIRRF